MRPGVTRTPTRLQNDDGRRIDPPVSSPTPTSARFAAIAAAVPLVVGLLRLRIAEVVLLLGLGILFGPQGLGWIAVNETTDTFNELGLGMLFSLLAFLAVILSRLDSLERYPRFLKLLVFTLPLPYLANQLGWIVAEMGRQPWIVYGIMKTSDGVSKSITLGQVAASLVGFVLLYGLLAPPASAVTRSGFPSPFTSATAREPGPSYVPNVLTA